ncbi:hypothetical protein [Halostreptopolyspora alba]|uniref:Uncharacterized protein n=1 Tax=Halostreptopolyspora alba TaxID=2487137 RepID=A0A3N0E3W3_9ACTN|nr:hypothetical protein EFW17_18735 [Nocardiopsaceae bacterium YIM 96095]
MSEHEAGGDVSEISPKAREAARLADAMSGLRTDFEDVIGEAMTAAGEQECIKGYIDFREKYLDDVIEVENHGMRFAENIDAAGAEIGEVDRDSTDGFDGAWPGLERDIHS